MQTELIEIRHGRRISVNFAKSFDKGKPTIFLIHGLGGRSQQWRFLQEALKKEANLVIPDLLGHGQSDKPHGPHFYKIEEMYQDLVALLNRYSGEKNYVIAHSLAGVLGLMLADAHQTQIQKLVLITPLNCEPKTDIPFIFHLPVWALDLLQNKLTADFNRLAFVQNDSQELIRQETEAANKNKMYVIKPLLLDMKNIFYEDVSQITTNTLLIVTEKDHVVDKDICINFYRRLPNLVIHEIMQTGHLPMLEKPNEVIQLVQDFLFGSGRKEI